jgi:hypothetical protein
LGHPHNLSGSVNGSFTMRDRFKRALRDRQ